MTARATISRCAMPPDSAITGALGPLGEAELLEQPVGLGLRLLGVHAEEAAVEVEVLPHGERPVERVGLGHDADQPLGLGRVARRRRRRRRAADPPVGMTRVVSMPAVVVLPAPFGPSRPKISPRSTVRSRRVDGADVARVHLGEAGGLDRRRCASTAWQRWARCVRSRSSCRSSRALVDGPGSGALEPAGQGEGRRACRARAASRPASLGLSTAAHLARRSGRSPPQVASRRSLAGGGERCRRIDPPVGCGHGCARRCRRPRGGRCGARAPVRPCRRSGRSRSGWRRARAPRRRCGTARCTRSPRRRAGPAPRRPRRAGTCASVRSTARAAPLRHCRARGRRYRIIRSNVNDSVENHSVGSGTVTSTDGCQQDRTVMLTPIGWSGWATTRGRSRCRRRRSGRW